HTRRIDMRNTMLKFGHSTALLVALLAALLSTQAFAAQTIVTLYKNLQCNSCDAHLKYLEEQGYKVEVKPVPRLHSMNQNVGLQPLEYIHDGAVKSWIGFAT